jgi:hypothetical protein
MLTLELDSLVDKFNELDLDNQQYLLDLFQKQINEKKRLDFIKEIELAELNIKSGNFKVGTLDDFLAELDDD